MPDSAPMYPARTALGSLWVSRAVGSTTFCRTSSRVHTTTWGTGLSKVRKAMAWDDQVMKPIGTYYCPSRRPAEPYGLGWATGTGVTFANLNKPVTLLAKNDYAVNAGDTMYRNNGPDGNPHSTGISFYASNVTMADVKDGSSNTFMCGEKYMNPDAYADEAGTAEWGDDGSAIAGHTWQHARWTYYDSASPENSYVPRQDTPGLLLQPCFVRQRAQWRAEHGPMRRLRANNQL